jgi:3-hydroxy-9,10-secoandrosta-1,3,5(10)-triene-9,17-dione monooxygenase
LSTASGRCTERIAGTDYAPGWGATGMAGEPAIITPISIPTSREVIARAAGLREKIRADAEAAESRGYHSESLQAEFIAAGFYRILLPRMFGGYELDLPIFYKTMLEVARADPGTAWCLTLCASHCLLVSSHWPEKAQREVFVPGPYFAAAHRPATTGTAISVEGGYVVDGVWDYCSGIPYSTHFIAGCKLFEGNREAGVINCIVPRAQVTMLDDWGGDLTLGMRSSGSHSVKIDKVFVPAHRGVKGWKMWAEPKTMQNGTPGTRLHKNPMYLGRIMGPYHMSIVTPVVGAARAAIDEFERMLTTRKTVFPPIVWRYQSADFQRIFGQAQMLADTAEAVLVRASEIYMEYCERWAADGTPITVEENIRLWGMVQHAGRIASEATEVVFNAARSGAAKNGSLMERCYRDCAMYRSHISSQHLNFAAPIARAHFGLKLGIAGL